MRKRLLHLGAVLAFLLSVVAVPVTAFANDGEEPGSGGNSTLTEEQKRSQEEAKRQEMERRKSELSVREEEHANNAELKEKRLSEAKLKVCEKRKATVEAIMARSIVRAEKQITLFSTIADRTEAFYKSKNRLVTNHDELLAAVNDAKAQAQTDLQALKESKTFQCDSSDPKGSVGTFKAALHKEIEILKTYRTAVRNFIVAVKSAQEGE